MKKVNYLAVTLSLLLAATLLSACSKKKEGEAESARGGTLEETATRFLRFQNLSEPEYIDPGLASGNVETNILLALFEGLVQYNPKGGEPLPGIAERWTLSPDKKVYTFHLRKGVKWNDGHPVVAQDFVYSWERVLNPKTAAKYAFALYYIKNAHPYNTGKLTDPSQLGFKALDDSTLQVTLENPTPFFLELLCYTSFRPVPKWVVEKHGPRWTQPENIVTNGPFKLKSWTPYKELTVVKDPNYWDAAQVKLAGIVFYPVEDKDTALKMYETGEIDVAWELPAANIPTLMSREDFVKAPYIATYFYRLNVTKPPLNDKRVRQALSHAIDRKTLCEAYLQKTEMPHSGLVPLGMEGYSNVPGLELNVEKAKQLLAEAGYPDPSQLPPITIHYNTDDRHKLVAQVVQQMWKKHLGINVQLWNEEWKSYLKTQNMLGYQISRSGWIGDYPDPTTFLDMFASDSTINHTGWKNANFDALLKKAAQELNTQKRFETLRQAEALILEEAPVIPFYTYTKMYLIKPYVKGFWSNLQDIHPSKWIYLEGDSAEKTVAN